LNPPNKQLAVMLCAVQGKLSRWRKGQKVKVYRPHGCRLWVIERMRWIGRGRLMCQNVCIGIPRQAFEIVKPKKK
jgi:hypothetical protein